MPAAASEMQTQCVSRLAVVVVGLFISIITLPLVQLTYLHPLFPKIKALIYCMKGQSGLMSEGQASHIVASGHLCLLTFYMEQRAPLLHLC